MSNLKGVGLPGLLEADLESLFTSFREGECLQDILGWSDEQVNELYDCLKELNQTDRWDEALDAATFLITVNPSLGRVYTEAGFAYHNKEMLPEAIKMYSLGARHTAGDLQPFIYMTHCYQALGDKENAIKSLENAILCIKTSNQIRPWELLLEELEETLITLKSDYGTR